MNTQVLKLSKQAISDLQRYYANHLVANKNPYVTAAFKLPDVMITVYTSGKVMFQGERAPLEAGKWGAVGFPMIGSDEVGNGSYFGGLTVVASFVTPGDHAYLRSLGVDDSKKMTDQRILEIAPLLKENIPHQALLLSPSKYNEVIDKGYNAISVKVALHNQAIYLLLQKGVQPEKIIIDAFTSLKNYDKYLAKKQNHFANPITLEEKAEGKYLAVAVSSIIARAMFLENLDQLSQSIGYTLPSGAGSKSDQVASKILQKYGLEGLRKTAKLHFSNTQKAHKLLK